MPYRYFDDPYIYGPVTEEELSNLAVGHRTTNVAGQLFIGVTCPLDYLADRLIEKPNLEPVVEQTPEE